MREGVKQKLLAGFGISCKMLSHLSSRTPHGHGIYPEMVVDDPFPEETPVGAVCIQIPDFGKD